MVAKGCALHCAEQRHGVCSSTVMISIRPFEAVFGYVAIAAPVTLQRPCSCANARRVLLFEGSLCTLRPRSPHVRTTCCGDPAQARVNKQMKNRAAHFSLRHRALPSYLPIEET